jgi:starch synthase
MKVAFCASEVVPFAKTGGLADVAAALPVALNREGIEVIVIMPRYRGIKTGSAKIAGKVKVYFIEEERYFNRGGLYGNAGQDYADNLERFSFYCREALALLKEINYKPDWLHLNDWQAALIAVYLKSTYAGDDFFSSSRTLLTIHNIGYQGVFPKEEFPALRLRDELFNVDGLEFYGRINLLKAGIIFSDLINTVSPTYAKEILTDKFGFGLEGVLKRRRSSFSGILNGLDYATWNPNSDKYIAAPFCAGNIKGKETDREDLRRSLGLAVNKDKPLIGIVSRLAEQKGFDLLAEAIDDICGLGCQVALLGVGDAKYHSIFREIGLRHKASVSVNPEFNEPLAHKIYAGSDIFLMPSCYEPCGLGQMIALRYGSIPVVFKTGGLADTVNSKNGFVFDVYSKDALVKAVKKAAMAYADKGKWLKLVEAGLRSDFSWSRSAKEYIKIYAKKKDK